LNRLTKEIDQVMMKHSTVVAASILLALATSLHARRGKVQRESLSAYIDRMQGKSLEIAPASAGSLWNDNGRLVGMATDYKAARTGDLITIVVAQTLSATNAGNVSTNRAFNATSGVSALAGHISTSGVQQIFSPNATQVLSGKSQAATTSSLNTSLAGRVVSVLPNGVLVVEAEREITMNNENQTLLLRGLVRPGDVGPDNRVSSNAIGNMELELKGRGVLSDGTRPPNTLVRMLLRVVGF
jgi:flagellar L-ring protein precursor FlgH